MALALCASSGWAQPRVANTPVQIKSAVPDLKSAIAAIAKSQTGTVWIGYAVPVVRRDDGPINDGWSERCRLEQIPGTTSNPHPVSGPIRLEPAPTVMVLARVYAGEVMRIRTFSTDCEVDTGGLPLFWFNDVKPSDSVAYLRTFLTDTYERGLGDAALNAIGLHQDAAASDLLLDLAKNSPDSRTRQRALVSIATRAQLHAAETISAAIERDPDNRVKQQAVYALSRLPKDQGVPLLIDLAKANANPLVRKEAISRLGDSRDPRALAYLEQILR